MNFLMNKKAYIFTVAVAVTSVQFATPASAASGFLPNYPNIYQLWSNWCWAAADLSILNYYGAYTTQCEIVKWTKLVPQCNVNLTATDDEAQDALHNWGVSTNNYSGALTMSQIVSQINGNKPIFTHLKWSTGGGHAVVLFGYDDSLQKVYYMDPGEGVQGWELYSKFKSSSTQTWISGLKDAWVY